MDTKAIQILERARDELRDRTWARKDLFPTDQRDADGYPVRCCAMGAMVIAAVKESGVDPWVEFTDDDSYEEPWPVHIHHTSAMTDLVGVGTWMTACIAVERALSQMHPEFMTLPDFNDTGAKRKREILALFGRAIRLVKSGEVAYT